MNLRQKILRAERPRHLRPDRRACSGQHAGLRRGCLVVPARHGRRRVPAGRRQADAAPGWQAKMPLLKSPLTLLGLLALGLGVVQLAPLPAGLARRHLARGPRGLFAGACSPDLVHADDPEASLPEAPRIRSPASLDRSATAALAGRRRGLPGDLLGRLSLHRSPGAAVPGLGPGRRGVPAQRGPGDRADHEPERGPVRTLRAGAGPRLGSHAERSAGDTDHGRPPRTWPGPPRRRRPRAGAPSSTPTSPIPVRDDDGQPGGLPGLRHAGHAAGPGDRLAPALAPRQPGEPVRPARATRAREAWCSCS